MGVIIKDPDILGGTPVFRGTRVPIQTLFDYLEGGETLEDFLEGFPTVSRESAVAARLPSLRSSANSASLRYPHSPLRHPLPHYPTATIFMYANCMLDEKDFQRKADAAFEDLKRRMLTAGDEHGFDVEG